MPKQIRNKTERSAPARSPEEDRALFKKLLIGFSIGQLVLAGVYYIIAAVARPVYLVLLAVTLLGMILAGKAWDKKAVRMIMRCLLGLVAAASLVFSVVYVCMLAYAGVYGEFLWMQVSMAVSFFMQTVLICLLPAYAMAANQDRKMDAVLLRIVSVAAFVSALVMVLHTVSTGYIVVWIDNLYFGLFYLLCTAVTAVLSFIAQPVSMPRWMHRIVSAVSKRNKAKDAQQETVAE